jgi:hypothetical protein
MSALDAWNSAACHRLSSAQGLNAADGLAFDAVHGVYVAPTSGQQRPVLRRLTWEDSLNISLLRTRGPKPIKTLIPGGSIRHATAPGDLEKLGEPRHSHRCRRKWSCDAIGLPAAVGTRQRPAKGFLAKRGARTFFALAIEKCGLTSLDTSLRRGGSVLSWSSVVREPVCRNTTGRALIEAVAALASSNGASTSTPEVVAAAAASNASAHAAYTACGYASTFALAESTFRLALVRNPIERFVSAVNDHGATVGVPYLTSDGRRHRETFHAALQRLKNMLYTLDRSRLVVGLVPPHATIHFLSQSYFLSSTDARGVPVQWDLLARLESLPTDLAQVASALLGKAGSTLPRRNAKADPARQQLVKALLNDTTAACRLCRVYRLDFVCLGYALPEVCTRRGGACRSARPRSSAADL